MGQHSINLIKIGNLWRVTYVDLYNEVTHNTYECVDDACNYLVDKLGVNDDAVDNALIDMVTKGTTRAMFDDNGEFSHSMVD